MSDMAPQPVVTLHGMAASTCTRRVLFLCNELGITVNLVEVDLMKGEQKTPGFLKLQPFGKVPVLVDEDNGVTLFESRAILRYLADTYGGNTLVYPTLWGGAPAADGDAAEGDAAEGADALRRMRALVDQWVEVEASTWNPLVSAVVAEAVFAPWRGQTTDEAVVNAKLGELRARVLPVYEAHLSDGRKYLAGDEFTLADITHAPYTHYMLGAGGACADAFEGFPNVRSWWDRVSGRVTFPR